MKKNFKFMLTAMLAVFGLSNASAQELKKGSTVNDAYYTYTLTSDPVETTADNYTANVELTKVRDGKNPVVSGAIYMPEHGVFTTAYGEENYTLTLTTISDANKPLRNLDLATTVTIPATVKAIPEFCFQGCSAMTSITFEANSQVESIGSWAFATTKITNFNFNNCVKLAELPDEVFVEPGLNNTYITEVTVPKSPLFKHINGAFQNLNKLTKINQLGESWIQEVIAEAFTGTELKELNLPGNALKYVDGEALKGLAKLEKLSIGVNKLLYLGGGHVNADYTFIASGYTTNLFGLAANNTLKELNLTGELMGKIAGNAFLGCTALAGNAGNTEAGLLDLTGMTLGSTGQIQANAFNGCTALKAVKVGNIANNETLGYTIEEYAFKDCANLATVTIGDITTSQAIGYEAFGTAPATVTIGKITASWAITNNAFPAVEKVTIGSIISNGSVFGSPAFVWKDTNGTFLKLATGTGEYLSQSSANPMAPAIPTYSFDFSAVGTLSTTTVMPEITIGKIYSKGGAFAMSAIRNATAPFKSVTFAGEIAANGIDAPIFELDNAVTALTFKGAIGEAGIAQRVFANQTKLTKLTFEGLLAEGAVAAGAFYDNTSLVSSVEEVSYTYDGIPDYTVNPFDIHAFDSDGGADVTTTRTIKFSVTDANLLANYKDETIGLETDGKFDIYLVYFYEEPEVIPTTFRVYQNGDTKYAWGRYDLGKFNIEKGPYADKDKSKWYVATDMIIPRYVNVDGVDIKLTLYGSYTDENPNAVVPGKTDKGESLVYMVPLQVYNGQYQIKKTNSKTIIVKAEAINGTFANKDIEIPYDNTTALTENSVWTTLPAWDTERGWHKNTTGDVVTTQILWDRTNKTDYDVWGADPDHTQTYAPKAIYSLSNPARYQGVDVVKVLVSKDSGKIGQNWYYTFLRHFGDTGSAARVIWMDEAEATAIFGVKENAKAAEKSGEMYNLQGIRISAPQKGQIYIIDGKKYIGK
jgi:hypothetical protein